MRHSETSTGTLMDTIRENPISSALVGLGVGWTLAGGLKKMFEGGQVGWEEAKEKMEGMGTGKAREKMYEGVGKAREKIQEGAGEVKEKMYEGAGEVKEKMEGTKMKEKIQEGTGKMKEKMRGCAVTAKEKADQAREQAMQWGSQAVEYMKENPFVAVGAALAIGAAVGLGASYMSSRGREEEEEDIFFCATCGAPLEGERETTRSS